MNESEQEELEKIKSLCEYLFFDQYRDMTSFPRFEEAFGFFVKEEKISLI